MRTARQISAQARKSQKASKDVPDFVDDGLLPIDDYDGDDDGGFHYRYNKDRAQKQFFIDRDGVSRKYTGDLMSEIISMHYHIAKDLFPDMQYPQSPDDHVCKVLGWILVGSTVYNTPICYRKPTAKQLQALRDLGDWYISRLCFSYKDSMVSYDKFGVLCAD